MAARSGSQDRELNTVTSLPLLGDNITKGHKQTKIKEGQGIKTVKKLGRPRKQREPNQEPVVTSTINVDQEIFSFIRHERFVLMMAREEDLTMNDTLHSLIAELISYRHRTVEDPKSEG